MSRCLFTPLTEQDLTDIHDYIASDSVANALRFVERVEDRCRRLAEVPRSGRERPELAPSARSVPEGNHVIFYRPTAEGITVLRVLHGGRDLDAIALDE